MKAYINREIEKLKLEQSKLAKELSQEGKDFIRNFLGEELEGGTDQVSYGREIYKGVYNEKIERELPYKRY